MGTTNRYITKISRVAQRYISLELKGTNLSSSAYECLRQISKHDGISQEQLRSILNIDKAAVARMAASLEKKGYIYRLQDENDKRAKKLFATEKALEIKNETSSGEAFFYEWLLEDIDENEKEIFLKVLRELYVKSKIERKEQFANILKREADANETKD